MWNEDGGRRRASPGWEEAAGGATSEIWSLPRAASWGPSIAECERWRLSFRPGNPHRTRLALGKAALYQTCPRITFLLSCSKIPSSPSSRLTARREEAACQGDRPSHLGIPATVPTSPRAQKQKGIKPRCTVREPLRGQGAGHTGEAHGRPAGRGHAPSLVTLLRTKSKCAKRHGLKTPASPPPEPRDRTICSDAATWHFPEHTLYFPSLALKEQEGLAHQGLPRLTRPGASRAVLHIPMLPRSQIGRPRLRNTTRLAQDQARGVAEADTGTHVVCLQSSPPVGPLTACRPQNTERQ